MLFRVHSFILIGIDAILCEVEVDVDAHGLEKTTVVGLAQAAVKESIERVRRAILNSGYPFTAHKLLINLAPADVKKEATAIDLPMAIGVLRGTNCIKGDRHKEFLIAGELALDGRVRKIKGGSRWRCSGKSIFVASFSPRKTPARQPSSKASKSIPSRRSLRPSHSLTSSFRWNRTSWMGSPISNRRSRLRSTSSMSQAGSGEACNHHCLAGNHNFLWSARPAPANAGTRVLGRSERSAVPSVFRLCLKTPILADRPNSSGRRLKEIGADAPTPIHGRAVVCRPGPCSQNEPPQPAARPPIPV